MSVSWHSGVFLSAFPRPAVHCRGLSSVSQTRASWQQFTAIRKKSYYYYLDLSQCWPTMIICTRVYKSQGIYTTTDFSRENSQMIDFYPVWINSNSWSNDKKIKSYTILSFIFFILQNTKAKGFNTSIIKNNKIYKEMLRNR